MSRNAGPLQELLRRARSRVAPESLGLPARVRRRLPGLSTDEVAELIGVSHVWYSRFERGRAQFSIAALERLATTLCLTGPERVELLRLARPEVLGFSPEQAADALSGVGEVLAEFARFAKSASHASSVPEIADGVSRAIHGLFGRHALGYFQSNEIDSSTMPFLGICGPSSCDSLLGYSQPVIAAAHVYKQLADGLFVEESDLSLSPSAEFRERVTVTGMLSYCCATFGRGPQEDGWRFGIGCALGTRHVATDLERSVIQTVAAIAELALCDDRVPRSGASDARRGLLLSP